MVGVDSPQPWYLVFLPPCCWDGVLLCYPQAIILPRPPQLTLKDCTVLGSSPVVNMIYVSVTRRHKRKWQMGIKQGLAGVQPYREVTICVGPSALQEHTWFLCVYPGLRGSIHISQHGSDRLSQWMELDKLGIPKQESQLSMRKGARTGPSAKGRIQIMMIIK